MIARIGTGLPLTFIGMLAVAVLLAWLFGGVGSCRARLSFGLLWLSALLIGWTLMLYRSDTSPGQIVIGTITIAITIGSFVVPILWKRAFGRHDPPDRP